SGFVHAVCIRIRHAANHAQPPHKGPAMSSPESAREIEVAPEYDGTRLDSFLAALMPDRSRSQIQRLIKEGHVTGGGTALRSSALVKTGQRFRVDIPAPEPAIAVAEDLPLAILYEDSDVVVLDKPAGMVVHPGAGHASGTLVNALLHHVDDLSGIGGEL